jgi:hypothetical protein
MPLPDDSYPKNIILKGIATYRLEYSEHKVELRRPRRRLDDLCTPGMGVNLWGESPLYVNPLNLDFGHFY